MSRDPRHRFASLGRAIRKQLVIGLAIVTIAAAGFSMFLWLAPAEAPPRNFVTHEAPRSIPTIAFEDDQGRARSLAEFRGRVVLLNIWATWCAPCRREMPALDRLQATLRGDDFEVMALSIDRAGIDAVRKFYADVALSNLAIYIDADNAACRSRRPGDRAHGRAGRVGRPGHRRFPAKAHRPKGRHVHPEIHVVVNTGADHECTIE
jgi:thiol-disulfide isomerase/thioredoxin